MTRKTEGSFTVTGNGLFRTAHSDRHGVSVAQSLASEQDRAATFYVRDPLGTTLFVVERDKDGTVTTTER